MFQSVLLPSAPRTVSGASSLVQTTKGNEHSTGVARFLVKVTAVAGTTPSLTPKLVGQINGVDVTLATLTAMTATGEQTVVVDACPDDVRLDWTISGTTPSFTFEAHCVRG